MSDQPRSRGTLAQPASAPSSAHASARGNGKRCIVVIPEAATLRTVHCRAAE
jgi:hypothetical protein